MNKKSISMEEKQAEIENLIKTAESGIDNYFTDAESIKEYLRFKAQFYKYSFMNNMLINTQFPGATAVGSYTFFKSKGFSVKRGEKAIKIRAMCHYDLFRNGNGEVKMVSAASPEEKMKIKSGEYERLKSKAFCKIENVFDISQTTATAADLPKLFPNKWLDGNVKDYHLLEKGARNIATKMHTTILPKPKSELGAAKGCCYPLSNEVALNPRNSELQNCKTLFHELAHSKMHTTTQGMNLPAYQKELQAEMTAYVICSHYDIDTSEYSFKYMHDWVKGKNLDDKKQLLKEVSDTAKFFIECIDEVIEQEHELAKDHNVIEENPDGRNAKVKNVKKMLAQSNIESSPRLLKNIQKLNDSVGKDLSINEIKNMQRDKTSLEPDTKKLVNSICKDIQQLEMVQVPM